MQTAAPTQVGYDTEAPPLCTSRCLFDSAKSQALLTRHNIHLTEHQIVTFRDIESHWDVELFNPDTASCLVNGRYDQAAADGYFYVLEEVRQLGRSALMETIVRRMAEFFPKEGVAFVLYAATVCMLFSDAVADEALGRAAQPVSG